MFELSQQWQFLPRTVASLILGFSLTTTAEIALANKPDNITETEMKLLPRYCPDTQGFDYGDASSNTSPGAAHWVALMGNGFWHIHHYCWAQINLLRAQRSGVPPQIKRGTLESVRADYQYVLARVPPDFIMSPEILTRLGDVELMLANPNGANVAFAKAREIKPDYWPAYSHWAEFLIRSGKQSEAKQLIRTALAYSPTAKVLLDQFRMLGGKPSEIPEPIRTPPAESDPASKIEPAAPDSTSAGDAPRGEK